jgi:hypothetical protein
MARIEEGIAKRRAEDVLEQLMHQLAAAAVRHEHVGMLRDWQRTTGVGRRRHTGPLPRRAVVAASSRRRVDAVFVLHGLREG